MSILKYSKVSITGKRGNMYLTFYHYRVYEHIFFNEPQIQASYSPFGLFLAVKCQIKYVHTTYIVKNKQGKLDGKGEASFDTPFMM